MYRAVLARSGCVELSPIINKKGEIPLLKVEACGICATDRKVLQRPPALMELPRVLGHECCGTLLTDLHSCPQGMRVALWPAITCGACLFCSSGRPQLCKGINLFGLHLDGGFSHTLSAPAHLLDEVVVLPLPPALSSREAVFAEPLGCVLHGLAKEHKTPQSIMIYGAGLMGRLTAQAARWRWPAAEINIYDTDALRTSTLDTRGVKVVEPKPADLTFIACSSQEALRSALDLLAPGGTIILFSGLPDRENRIEIDHNQLHRKEQTLTGSYGCTPQDMSKAIALLAEGQIVVTDFITKTLPLAHLGEELARPTTSKDFKTIIVPSPQG